LVLCELALQQVAAIGRRLDLALQIGLDEVFRPSVRDLSGKGRVRAGEPDVDETGETRRGDVEMLDQHLARDPLARRPA
ncbi:hypothetical protein, partial [Salmonella enterica]|uniref:hypothetical protein n=1 Tax=Salmonella enterica TaxID=28901 RepID=UPI001BAEF3CD